MTTHDQAMAELRAGVAALTAAYQHASGELDRNACATVFASLAVESFPGREVEFILPVSWLALRCLSLAAEATDRTVPELLAQLGAEAAGPPPNDLD
jgi:hypothetical protein